MANEKKPKSAQEQDQNQAHPPGWPGIPGRSRGHEPDLETGTDREHQAGVTDAQRKLEEPEGEK